MEASQKNCYYDSLPILECLPLFVFLVYKKINQQEFILLGQIRQTMWKEGEGKAHW